MVRVRALGERIGRTAPYNPETSAPPALAASAHPVMAESPCLAAYAAATMASAPTGTAEPRASTNTRTSDEAVTSERAEAQSLLEEATTRSEQLLAGALTDYDAATDDESAIRHA